MNSPLLEHTEVEQKTQFRDFVQEGYWSIY